MPCPVCNRTIASGDFCDDLQCPNPTRDGADGAGDEYCHNEGATFCSICGLAKPGHIIPDKAAPPQPAPDAMREWLVIESSYKNTVFAPDDSKMPKGYIPRDVAEKLLGKALDGVVWFTREESAKMREHPDWRETLPPQTSAPVPPADGAGAVVDQILHQFENDDRTQHPDYEVILAIEKIQSALLSPSGTGAAEPVLRLLQASSCFRGEVCTSLPCACAESLADLSLHVQPGAGERA